MPDFSTFETKIGYSFKTPSLLEQAFTHRSYLNENRAPGREHNERLEFLGDAVLELVVTEFLYGKYPEKPRDDAADQERLQEWADQPAEAKAEAKAAKADKSDDDNDRPRSSGGSRSDSFWTTVGKTIIRTGVPLATKMLTDALKGRNRRG